MLLLSLLLRLLVGSLVRLFLLATTLNRPGRRSRGRAGARVSRNRADSGPPSGSASRTLRCSSFLFLRFRSRGRSRGINSCLLLCLAVAGALILRLLLQWLIFLRINKYPNLRGW